MRGLNFSRARALAVQWVAAWCAIARSSINCAETGVLRGLLLVLGACLLTGCASVTPTTPVPGASTYCLETISTREFRSELKTSNWEYGPFKRHVIGGQSAICDLNRFYILSVKFETKDGRREDLKFDLVEIMQRFQDESNDIKRPFRHSSQPKLEIRYYHDQINIVYRVSEYQEGGVIDGWRPIKPLVIQEYPVLMHKLVSSTRRP